MLNCRGWTNRKLDKPERYYDRDNRPYRLDKGEVLVRGGKRPVVVKDRPPETIAPIKTRYTLVDEPIFSNALDLLIANETVRRDVRDLYRAEKKERRMTVEVATLMLAVSVADLRGISLEEGRGIVARRVASILHETEERVSRNSAPTGRELSDAARRRRVRNMRHHRKG